MRILILSQWYAPEPQVRVTPLAEALASRGHDVTVVTGFPNAPSGKIYPGYRLTWHRWDELNGVRILRLPLFPDQSRSPIKRSANYLSFSASLLSLGTFLLDRADVIFGYTVLVGVSALWFKMRFRAPVMLDIPDLYPDALLDTGMVKQGALYSTAKITSAFIYQNCDRLSVWHPGFRRVLIERGIPEEKISIVENWIDPDLYKPVQRDIDLARQYELEGKFNVVFAGNLGVVQGLETVIDAAKRLEQYKDLQFVIIGSGSCSDAIKQYAKQLGCDNVRFLGQQPSDKMADFFAWGDALLVHLKHKPSFEMTVPAKTHAYLACGKPVIMAVKGEAANLVESGGCGIVCPPEDPRALADAVIRLKQITPEERDRIGQAGLELFRSRYTKSILLEKLIELILETASIKS